MVSSFVSMWKLNCGSSYLLAICSWTALFSLHHFLQFDAIDNQESPKWDHTTILCSNKSNFRKWISVFFSNIHLQISQISYVSYYSRWDRCYSSLVWLWYKQLRRHVPKELWRIQHRNCMFFQMKFQNPESKSIKLLLIHETKPAKY